MKRRSPLHQFEHDAYQDLRAEIIGQPCQVCPRFAAIGVATRCGQVASEPHHLRKLSAGGARAHRDNVLPSCRWGNQYVEAEPELAKDAGLVIREGHQDWDRLSSRLWRKTHR